MKMKVKKSWGSNTYTRQHRPKKKKKAITRDKEGLGNSTSRYLSEETQSTNQRGTHMFIAALFTVAKIWKQPKCLSIDEWIKKCIYTMEYDQATKGMKVCHLQQHGWTQRVLCLVK